MVEEDGDYDEEILMTNHIGPKCLSLFESSQPLLETEMETIKNETQPKKLSRKKLQQKTDDSSSELMNAVPRKFICIYEN